MPSKRCREQKRCAEAGALQLAAMTARTSILAAICAGLLSAGCASGGRQSPVSLQSPSSVQRVVLTPGSWDSVAVLQRGSRVVITLIDGERVEAAFMTLSPEDVGVTDSAGQDLSISRSNIRQIVARGERDQLGDGALIGAGIGLGTAATILAIAASGDGYILASAKWGAPLLLSAVGGVIGVLVDRAHRDSEVVYVTP